MTFKTTDAAFLGQLSIPGNLFSLQCRHRIAVRDTHQRSCDKGNDDVTGSKHATVQNIQLTRTIGVKTLSCASSKSSNAASTRNTAKDNKWETQAK